MLLSLVRRQRSCHGSSYCRCCGIEVHKDFITACVLVNEPRNQREVRKKELRTYGSDLQKLKRWLYVKLIGSPWNRPAVYGKPTTCGTA
jgi:hypothetical protein